MRLLDANFGKSGRVVTDANRPLASNINKAFGFGPKTSDLRPSWLMVTFETCFHVPTRSLAVWATASPGSANPRYSSAMVHRPNVVCRFIVLSFECPKGFALGAQR